MISRVAEICHWLLRYVERADCTARLLRVHSGMVLDVALPPSRTWRPLLIVLGEEGRFLERFGVKGAQDGEAVQEYLAWDPDSPVSIFTSLRMAREGARTVRETVSLETWQALNATWIWLKDGRGRRLFNRERTAFYEELTHRCHHFHGACHNTMLHEEPFDFMRLGLNLERAGLTARILDLQHHALGNGGAGAEGTVEAVEWIAILRACAAYEPFFKKRVAPLSGPAVAEFLLLELAFPGSVHHGLNRARNFLARIRPGRNSEVGARSEERLRELHDEVSRMRIEEVLDRGIHEVLTGIVNGTAEVSQAIAADYFSASLPGDLQSAENAQAAQT